MREPGPLLASGRDSEIFDYGPGLVLRRSRGRRKLQKEAMVMRYVAQHDYPVPKVKQLSADGSELVMERIAGPTMLEAVSRRPWTFRRQAAALARLHQRLHEIPAPSWLDAFSGGGDRLVHLDLHPLNVILSPGGPVLIDWTNAARGAEPADVALTWLLMTAAEIPGAKGPGGRLRAVVGRALRALFVRSFLGHFDRALARAALPNVVDWKCRDPNMSPGEVVAMRRLAARESGR
jgi:aminoglycoside phosphotransferase (APT) family kinase protein